MGGITSAMRKRPASACSLEHQRLIAGCRRRGGDRRLGRRQLRSRRTDFIGGGNLWVYPTDGRCRAGMTPSVRRRSWGAAWKAFVRDNADRTNTSYCRRRRFPTRRIISTSIRGEDPLGMPVCGSRPTTRTTSAGSPRSSGQDGTVVSRGRRDRDERSVGSMGPTTHASAAHGWATRRDQRGRSVGFSHGRRTSGPRGVGHGHGGAESDAHRAGARVADREHLAKNFNAIATRRV